MFFVRRSSRTMILVCGLWFVNDAAASLVTKVFADVCNLLMGTRNFLLGFEASFRALLLSGKPSLIVFKIRLLLFLISFLIRS